MAQLFPGETSIRSGPVTLVGPMGPRSGTLTLTNQAMVFEGPGLGPVGPMRPGMGPRFGGRPGFGGRAGFGGGPGYGPRGPGGGAGVLRIPLWRCRTAAAANGPQGAGVQLTLLSRELFVQTDDAPGWAAAINQARANAPPPPPGAMGPGGGPGRAAMPRCEYCGQLSQTTATHCESCGAPF